MTEIAFGDASIKNRKPHRDFVGAILIGCFSTGFSLLVFVFATVINEANCLHNHYSLVIKGHFF